MSFSSIVNGLSPYSFYRCQETSGTTLTDSSTNSRNGTIQGTVTLNQAGLVFDGATAKSIRVGTNPTLGSLLPSASSSSPGIANSAFTIGFFWNPTQTAIAYVAAASNSGNTGNVGWNLVIDGTYLYLDINQGYNGTTYAGRVTYASAGISIGTEQLYWLTYDGSGNWSLYINGSNTALISATATTLSAPTTPNLAIGGINNQQQCAGGYFSEVMSFASVLSSANRLAIFNAANLSLTAPVVTITNNQTNVSLSWTNAGNGTAPYTYKLYRGTSPSPTEPASGQTIVYTGTTTSYIDTPVDTQLYYYHLVVNDSAPTPLTGISNTVPGQIVPKLVIGCIGDSRTLGFNSNGSVTDPVTQLGSLLPPLVTPRNVVVNNRGLGATTTASWLSGTTLSDALASIATSASGLSGKSKTYVQISLGVNDAELIYRITPTQYQANLISMINQIKAYGLPNFAGIILHFTFGPVANADAGYDDTDTILVSQYNSIMLSLCDGISIFAGDQLSFDYFATNQALMTDGLHPGQDGYLKLGSLWANAIANVVNTTSSSSQVKKTQLQRPVTSAAITSILSQSLATSGTTNSSSCTNSGLRITSIRDTRTTTSTAANVVTISQQKVSVNDISGTS